MTAPPEHISHPCPPAAQATIDLSALAHNLDQVRRRLTSATDILAVVKADAYGHGAVRISRTLADLGVHRFGVATVAEGIQLRENGLRGPILVMGGLLPNQCEALVAHRLTPIVHHVGLLEPLVCAIATHTPYPVHIKVDTGMGRLGFAPDDVLPLLKSPPFESVLYAEGLMTHLADADNPDRGYTTRQLERFQAIVEELKGEGIVVPLIHAANTAGLLCHPSSHFTLVRPGLMLYGYHTTTSLHQPLELRPVLTLVSRIVQLRSVKAGDHVSYGSEGLVSRPSRLAVLPIGYADGYSRLLSNRGAVLIRGRRAPILGRVCMDMTIVDVTDIPDVGLADEAVLIGEQGHLRLTAAHLASWSQTIPYEVLCAIGQRVRRVYR